MFTQCCAGRQIKQSPKRVELSKAPRGLLLLPTFLCLLFTTLRGSLPALEWYHKLEEGWSKYEAVGETLYLTLYTLHFKQYQFITQNPSEGEPGPGDFSHCTETVLKINSIFKNFLKNFKKKKNKTHTQKKKKKKRQENYRLTSFMKKRKDSLLVYISLHLLSCSTTGLIS